MTLERAFEDSGEDHWLCTLMVHSGWCFQYCTACENEPYCSEEFEEFYKQRRHWIASTLVNIISLIKEWSLAKMRQLDDYIKHYEELRYSTQNLHNKHMRAKRSTGSKSLDLKFKAHSREFHLDLKPSTSSITESYRSTHNNGTEDPADLAILYEGSVRGLRQDFH
ncbi:disintegrin and metalloproteinase domain-containing protein 10-like isoform X3 [Crassostrea virginica]